MFTELYLAKIHKIHKVADYYPNWLLPQLPFLLTTAPHDHPT